MKKRLRHLLGLLGTGLLAFLALGLLSFALAYCATSVPSPSGSPTEAPAAGGEAYKGALLNVLKARGYEGFQATTAVEGGKFKVEATGKVGACTVGIKWIVGVLSPAQQVAPAIPSGTVVKYKLDEVKQGSKMVKYALDVANPSPAEVQSHLKKNSSPCKP
jgi:hypothetical protein